MEGCLGQQGGVLCCLVTEDNQPFQEDGWCHGGHNARDVQKGGRCSFVKTLAAEGSHLLQKCEMLQGLNPVDGEKII